MNLYEWFQSEKGSLLIAGLAGSAVSSAMEWTGVVSSIRKMVVGTLSALYLSPLAIPMLTYVLSGVNVPPENSSGVGGFLMGVVGIVVIEIIMKVFRLKRDSLGSTPNDTTGGA